MSAPHNPQLCGTCESSEYEAFRHNCVHESMDKNELWLDRYDIRELPAWAYSLEEATLTFSDAGKTKVICQMQVVGTIQEDTWQWSWSNRSLPLRSRERLSAVKQLGMQKSWMRLTAPFLNSDEYFGWDCASIASHILDGEAAYRCPTEDGFVYLVILSTQFIA